MTTQTQNSQSQDTAPDEDPHFDLFSDFTPTETALLVARSSRMTKLRRAQMCALPPSPADRSTIQNRRFFLERRGVDLSLRQPLVIPFVWSQEECCTILSAVLDRTGTGADGGWTITRHSAFPTTDVPVDSVPLISAFVRSTLVSRLLAAVISPHYGFHPSGRDLAFRDLFFVRYSALESGAQRSLGPHTDGCLISFNVLLNGEDEFEGGGTLFVDTGETVKLRRGEAVVHDSRCMHAGVEITTGVRYICVGFVDTVDTVRNDERLSEETRATGIETGRNRQMRMVAAT